MCDKRKQAGFTLVEMLAVLAILPMVLVLIHTALSGTLEVAEMTERVREDNQVVRSLRTMFSQDIKACVLPKAKKGLTQQEDSTVYSLFLGKDSMDEVHDSLSFVTLRPSRAAQPALELNEVGYELCPNLAGPGYFRLMRREQRLYDETPTSGGMYQEIYDRVLSLEIRYFDGKEWLDEWDSGKKNALPYAVHVSMKIMLPAGEEKATATVETLVRIPASALKVTP